LVVRIAEKKKIGCSEFHEHVLSDAGLPPIVAESSAQESHV
jgi:hypothetical protein